MILGFIQYLDKKKQKPSYFREKIWAGADIHTVIATSTFNKRTLEVTAPKLVDLKPKLHTLRADPHDRWKPGMSIQMVYRGAGYKIIDEFNKGIPELSKCISTQKIEIRFEAYKTNPDDRWCVVEIDGKCFWAGIVVINPKLGVVGVVYAGSISPENIHKLAVNDGFDSPLDFFAWFKKDFSGKLIHWTDLKY